MAKKTTAPVSESPSGRPKRSPIVAEALAFQKTSSDAYFNQRLREEAALRFQVPENQWPDDVKAARQGQNVNGVPLPARPMLSIPILDQPIQLQLNQQQQAHLGVQVHPLSQGANNDTAQILQGLYRHIEVESRAELARSWAYDRAIKAGWGAYRVNVVYDEASEDPRDLTIRIDRILHQSSVYLDPFAQQPDWSDGKRALVVSYVPWEQYKREYPESSLESYGDDELGQLATDYPFWLTGEGDARAVCVAEYFYTTYRERKWAILDDNTFAFEDEIPEGRTIAAAGIRTVDWPEVRWCKINAVEELDSRIWNGRYIPIIPVIGRELQPFQGSRVWMGMIEPNMDAARLVNYEVSNAVEKDALAPKAPYVGAVGQFKTMRKQWDQANVRNFSTLEYDPVSAGGQLAPPPQRNMISADLSSALALVELAKNLVQIGTSTTDAGALEQLAKRRVAKDTIVGLAQQSEVGNSNYLQNLATISMPYEARVVLDLIPTLFDREGRTAQILGTDNKRSAVMLNAPFVRDQATQQPQPVEGDATTGNVLHYDFRKGKYGYVVEIGKSFKSRMQAGGSALTELIAAQPQLMQILGDVWAQFQDFPGHEEVAKRFKAMLPPQIQQLEAEPESPEAMRQKLSQAGQMIQQMAAAIEQLQKEREIEAAKEAAETQRTQMDNTAKQAIAAAKNATDIQLQAMKDQLKKLELMFMAKVDAAEREDTQAHEMALAAADAAEAERQADKQIAAGAEKDAMAHAHASMEGERGRQATAEEAERNRQAQQETGE